MTSTALTLKEDLICRLKCHGLQRKEIASKLHISENTMITYDKHIHEKLHASNNVEVVINYVEEKTKIDIRKLIQITFLLMIMLPSIIIDEAATVRVFRTAQLTRTARARRNESEVINYLPNIE